MRKEGTRKQGQADKTKNNRTVKKLTEETANETNESPTESDESIHHIEETKNIEEKQKQYTAKKKINRIQKEFIIDTGSTVTITPFDERIVNQTELQKITNRYKDVNENEVKFRGRIPVNIEYKSKKQKWKF